MLMINFFTCVVENTELSPPETGEVEELSDSDTPQPGPAPSAPYNAVLTFQGLVVQLYEEREEKEGVRVTPLL